MENVSTTEGYHDYTPGLTSVCHLQKSIEDDDVEEQLKSVGILVPALSSVLVRDFEFEF